MLREGFDGLGSWILGGGKLGEDLAGLAEGDAGAVLECLCDAAIWWREGCDVVFGDFGVGMGVEVGCYCEEFWGMVLVWDVIVV